MENKVIEIQSKVCCETEPVACPGIETCSRLPVIDMFPSTTKKSEVFHADFPTSKEFLHALPVFLTDVELGCYSKQQAELWTKWGKLNQEKKDSAKMFKDLIEGVEKQLDDVTRIVEEGSEERPVMCKWMFNYDENEKILIRMDSMEIVERKTISKEEMERWRNPELPIESPENVDQAEEAADILPESSEGSEGGKMEEADAISVSGASTLVEGTEKVSAEVPKCCTPKDRAFFREGDIRLMYCKICRRVIQREDMSVSPSIKLDVHEGELFEVES